MNEKLKELYQNVILEHNNNPVRFVKSETSEYIVEAYNQICGDRFKLFFDLKDGKMINASFHGFGCAISKASTSVLLSYINGKTLEEVGQTVDSFLNILDEQEEITEKITDDFEAFTAAKSFPGRAKCATLTWEELKLFLSKLEK